MREHFASGPFSLVGANIAILVSLALVYAGVLRFFGRPVPTRWLIAICTAVPILSFGFFHFCDTPPLRYALRSGILAACCLVIARALFVHRDRPFTPSSHLASLAFLGAGVFFVGRTFVLLTTGALHDVLGPSFAQAATFLAMLTASPLWTFGLTILVNQRLLAEQTEAKTNLEFMVNTTPDAVLVTRLADGKIVEANRGFEMLTGLRRIDTLKKTTIELDLWESPKKRDDFAEVLQQGGACNNLENVFHRTNGEHLVGLSSARLMHKQGAPHVVSVIRDITDRKRAEEAILRSHQVLQSALDGLPAHVALLDDQGTILLVNKAWRLFAAQNGADPDKVSEGANYLQGCAPLPGIQQDEARAFSEGIRNALADQRDFTLEYSRPLTSAGSWDRSPPLRATECAARS